jgi:hypothetical protein
MDVDEDECVFDAVEVGRVFHAIALDVGRLVVVGREGNASLAPDLGVGPA